MSSLGFFLLPCSKLLFLTHHINVDAMAVFCHSSFPLFSLSDEIRTILSIPVTLRCTCQLPPNIYLWNRSFSKGADTWPTSNHTFTMKTSHSKWPKWSLSPPFPSKRSLLLCTTHEWVHHSWGWLSGHTWPLPSFTPHPLTTWSQWWGAILLFRVHFYLNRVTSSHLQFLSSVSLFGERGRRNCSFPWLGNGKR